MKLYVSYQVQIGSLVFRNPLLPQAPDRYRSLYRKNPKVQTYKLNYDTA